MGLIFRRKKAPDEIKEALDSVEEMLNSVERKSNMVQTNIIGEETLAVDTMRHDLTMAAIGRGDVSPFQRYDEQVSYIGDWLRNKLRENFSIAIDVFSAYDHCSMRWIIKAETSYSIVSKDFTRESLDNIDLDKIFEFFSKTIAKSISLRFRKKVEIELPVKRFHALKCECCGATLTSSTCEYCGTKYFFG